MDGTGVLAGVRTETRITRSAVEVRILVKDRLAETRTFDRTFFQDSKLDTFKVQGDQELTFYFWGSAVCSRNFSNPPKVED